MESASQTLSVPVKPKFALGLSFDAPKMFNLNFRLLEDAIGFALTISVANLRVKAASDLLLKGSLGNEIAASVTLAFDNSARSNPRYSEPVYLISAKLVVYGIILNEKTFNFFIGLAGKIQNAT